MEIQEKLKKIILDYVNNDPNKAVALKLTSNKLNFEYDINGNESFPAASILKVPMAIALYNKTSQEDRKKIIDLSKVPKTFYASILDSLNLGSLPLESLCGISLSISDNGASNYIIDQIGIKEINQTLISIGCSNKSKILVDFSDDFLNEKGLVNTTTAKDFIKVFEFITGQEKYGQLLHYMKRSLRNNRIPALLPEDVCVAHKTGTLSGSVNDTGVILESNYSLYISFLTKNLEDYNQASNDIAICTEKAHQALEVIR